MTTEQIIALAISLLAAAVVYVGRIVSKAFLSEKAKNYATRQDVEEITRKVEGAKLESARQLEQVRAELSHATHVDRVQFEKEFKIYGELWAALVDVQNTALALRPVLDHMPEDEEARAQQKIQRMQAFADSFATFAVLVEKQRPFYAEAIYVEVGKLLQVSKKEFVQYRVGRDQDDLKYWDQALANSEAIAKQSDAICDAIRERISTVRVI